MNVKKIISVFLVSLLLISNIGITLNVHYCSNSIASISLHSEHFSSKKTTHCCSVLKSTPKGSCCKDRLVHLEKKADQAIEKIVLSSLFSPFILIKQQWLSFCFSNKTNYKKSVVSTYYVPGHSPPLYQLYHQYIFYA